MHTTEQIASTIELHSPVICGITVTMSVQSFLSNVIRPGSGVYGTPLAYMRSGAVPWLPSKRASVFFVGSIYEGIRLGAAVHYASQSEAVRP